MSYPVYIVPAGDVLPIFFATYAGSTGASATLSGLAVTDIEVYKDGSATQRASDAGYTLLDTDGIDFDGVTGIHGFSIDTGDNTDAGFYTVGAWYTVVVSSVTVDSQTVNFIAAAFRLVPAESSAGVPKADVSHWLGTAAATPTVAGVPEVDVTHWIGTAAATPTTAGVPEVDVTHWSGTAVASPDTAGYPKVTVKSGTGTGEISLTDGRVALQSAPLSKNVAVPDWGFVMTDSTNHNPVPGKTVTVYYSHDGGDTYTSLGTATESAAADGGYFIDITQAAMNADKVTLKMTAAGCDTLWQLITTRA